MRGKTEFQKRVTRSFDRVHAEIYYHSTEAGVTNGWEIYVTDKYFSEPLWFEPNEKTYERANKWADNVLMLEKNCGTK